MQGVVKAEGEGAEWTEGLMAAAVSEQGSPEVIIQDVGPRSFWKKVLVCFDGSAGRTEEMNSDIIFFFFSYFILIYYIVLTHF